METATEFYEAASSEFDTLTDEEIVLRIKGEDGQEDVFYIVEETKLAGVSYILVTDTPEDEPEADAYILKDVSSPDSEEAIYEFVEDDRELKAIADVFAELLEDTDIL